MVVEDATYLSAPRRNRKLYRQVKLLRTLRNGIYCSLQGGGLQLERQYQILHGLIRDQLVLLRDEKKDESIV